MSFNIELSPTDMLDAIEDEFHQPFRKLSKISSSNPEKHRKCAKKIMKTYAKSLLNLLEKTLPSKQINDAKHLTSAAYVATKLYALKNVLPSKHMLLIANHLSRGISFIQNSIDTSLFRLHKTSIHFIEATCTDQRLLQPLVIGKIWSFFRTVSHQQTQTMTSQEQHLLFEHVTTMIKYALTLTRDLKEEKEQEKGRKKENSNSNSNTKQEENIATTTAPIKHFQPRQHTLMLLLDHVTSRGTNYLTSKMMDSLLKLCTNHARKSSLSFSSIKSSDKNNKKNKNNKNNQTNQQMWHSELPLVWSKVLDFRCHTLTNKNIPSSKSIASLERSLKRLKNENVTWWFPSSTSATTVTTAATASLAAAAPNMLETLRTVVGHVHAVHVYIISLSKQNKNGRSNGNDNQQLERIQTYGKTLEMCWNHLRSLLLSLMNVVQKIREEEKQQQQEQDSKQHLVCSNKSIRLIHSLVKNVIVKSMELAVVHQLNINTVALLNVTLVQGETFLETKKQKKQKKQKEKKEKKDDQKNESEMNLLNVLSRTLHLGAKALHGSKQYENAIQVALLSCSISETYLSAFKINSKENNSGSSSNNTTNIKEMKKQTMYRYGLLSGCQHESSAIDSDAAALNSAVRALELCDANSDALRSAVVRVVRREMSILRCEKNEKNTNEKNEENETKKESKKKKNKDKEKEITTFSIRVPWKKIYSMQHNKQEENALRLLVAFSYRFYYREWLGGTETCVPTVLRRCRKEHERAVKTTSGFFSSSSSTKSITTSITTSDVLLMLEKVRMQRERCAAMQQKSDETYTTFLIRAKEERTHVLQNAKKNMEMAKTISTTSTTSTDTSATLSTTTCDSVLAHILSMCLVSVCHVEAQSENVDAIDSQEMNMDSMNHETIQNILTLLKSLSNIQEKKKKEKKKKTSTSSSSFSSSFSSSLIDMKDFLSFVQGWCGMLSLHGNADAAVLGLLHLSTFCQSASSSSTSSNTSCINEDYKNSILNDYLEVSLLTTSATSATFTTSLPKIIQQVLATNQQTTNKRIVASKIALQLAPMQAFTTKQSIVALKEYVHLLCTAINKEEEKKEKKEKEEPTTPRDLSYYHYVLSKCLDVLHQPTATMLHATASKNVRKSWGLSQTDLDATATLRLGLEVPVEEEENEESPLRPTIRMDQWCLLRDFFSSADQMADLCVRRGQPHRAAYWLEQAKMFAQRLGCNQLVLNYIQKEKKLIQRRYVKNNNDNDSENKNEEKVAGRNLVNVFANMTIEDIEDEDEDRKDNDDNNVTENNVAMKCETTEENKSLLFDVTKTRDILRQRFTTSSISTTSSSSSVAASLRSIGLAYELEERCRTKRCTTTTSQVNGVEYNEEQFKEEIQITNTNSKQDVKTVASALNSVPSVVTLVSLSMTNEYKLYVTRASGTKDVFNDIKDVSDVGDVGDEVLTHEKDGAQDVNGSVHCCRMNGNAVASVLNSFDSVIKASDDSTISSKSNYEAMSVEDRNQWWQIRDGLDDRMKQVLNDMGNMFDPIAASMLLGQPIQNEVRNEIDSILTNFCNEKKSKKKKKTKKEESQNEKQVMNQLQHLLWAADKMQDEELATTLQHLFSNSSFASSSSATIKDTIKKIRNIHEKYVTQQFSVVDKGTVSTLCQEKGLSHTGNKNVLVERLVTYELSMGKSSRCGVLQRFPVILLLDHTLSKYPWESISLLRKLSITRMPSLHSIQRSYQSRTHNKDRTEQPEQKQEQEAQEEQEQEKQEQKQKQKEKELHASLQTTKKTKKTKKKTTRTKKKTTTKETKKLKNISSSLVSSSSSASGSIVLDVGDCNTTFVINPSGDLTRTENTFRSQFISYAEQGISWKGSFGTNATPSIHNYVQNLKESNMIVYCGHGSSEKFYNRKKISESYNNHGTMIMLMGCSSVKLKEEGVFDAHGMVHGYLMSGCSLVVGNLWDVTDKDIDRFCINVLDVMISSKSGGGDGGDGGSSDKGDNSRDSGNSSSEHLVDVLQAVAVSRDKCKMKYMIGAAPVCYGIPVVVHCTVGKM